MNAVLFRPQVLALQQGARYGEAMFYQPVTVRLMVLFLIAVFVAFLAFAANADIRQTERVRGYLTAAGGEVKVYGDRSGVVAEVLVDDGDFVRAGAILAVVNDPRFDQYGKQYTGVALQQIDVQLQHLRQRQVVMESRFDAQAEQVRGQLSGQRRALQLLLEEHEILQRRVALSVQDLQASNRLLRGRTISQREHRQSESAHFLLQQQEKTSALTIMRQRQAITDAEQQMDLQPLLAQEEWLMLENTMSQLLSRRHELQSRHRFTITATRDGVISNFILRVGDLIDPGEPILTLLHAEDELEAWLYLPSRALANVSEGVDVMISYDAYPYQTYGSFPAQVQSVADSVMDPREFLFPVDVREPVYLVKARIFNQNPGNDADKHFRPGMQFSADIVTGQNTVLQKLVSPLNGLGMRL